MREMLEFMLSVAGVVNKVQSSTFLHPQLVKYFGFHFRGGLTKTFGEHVVSRRPLVS